MKALRHFQIIGDSMAPTFQPGQLVMVDTSDRRPTAGVFLIWDGVGFVAKRLESTHTNPVRVRVMSDNKRYNAYEAPPAAVEIEGRIVAAFNRL